MWGEGILFEGSICEHGLLSKALLNTGLRSLGVQGPVVWRLACFWGGGPQLSRQKPDLFFACSLGDISWASG